MICIHEEEITKEKIRNEKVVIVPSSNPADTENIVVGGDPFVFSEEDDTLTVKVTFNDPKVPVRMNLLNTNNVDVYNMTVTYTDGNIIYYTVSKMLFS